MSDEEEEYDSDTVLQELYAVGKIKPGLNIPVENKIFINDTTSLGNKFKQIKKNFPWTECMDVINDCAPLAPELSMELMETEEFVQSGRTDSVALNEFKRETLFHRQAQAAVTEGLSRLHSSGIPTTRPDDNFAEMMKSDIHMQKVRQSLLQKQAGLERSEKVKKIRIEKKLAKQKQVENTLRKQKDKKKLSEEIKKYRKGIRKDLDFLEPTAKKRVTDNNRTTTRVNKKRKTKDKKYGYGGKKRGMKNNQFNNVKKNFKKTRPGKSKRQNSKKR